MIIDLSYFIDERYETLKMCIESRFGINILFRFQLQLGTLVPLTKFVPKNKLCFSWFEQGLNLFIYIRFSL